MGYIKHHGICVTSWNGPALAEAAEYAASLGMTVIGPSEPKINGYQSIFICPDGSKEGWVDSNAGDEARRMFKAWLLDHSREDWSSPFEWVEVAYGADDAEAVVVDHQWV